MAARLEALAEADTILVGEATRLLIEDVAECSYVRDITPKGFVRPVRIYRLESLKGPDVLPTSVTRKGDHVEVNITDSRNIRQAIEELKRIQEEFEQILRAES